MIKRLWGRVKETVGIVPKEDRHQALRDFLAQPWSHPVPGSFQQGGGQELTPEGFYHRNLPKPTTQELIAGAQDKLKPRLVSTNKSIEPNLTQPGRKRYLSPLWILWAKSRYMLTEDAAWQMGAEKMMDYEFNAKMRGNVEILPRCLVNPCLVSIHYNDPGKVGA